MSSGGAGRLPGEVVSWRQTWHGRTWAEFPVTIVEDSEDRLLVYLAPGTPFLRPDCARADHLSHAARGVWNLVEDRWAGEHHLWAHRPGESFCVWTRWEADTWRHLGWKANIESPLQRRPDGFAMTDLILDVAISPDQSSWELVDEHELDEAVALGLLDEEASRRILATALEVRELLRSERREDLRRWAAWRPVPAGGVPE